jgi:hypothetical protein
VIKHSLEEAISLPGIEPASGERKVPGGGGEGRLRESIASLAFNPVLCCPLNFKVDSQIRHVHAHLAGAIQP